MFRKILIKGEIEVLTGMHIGTGGEYSAIGAADSPVVRDPVSKLPIIPGSSFKGKLRAMLAAKYGNMYSNNDGEDVKRIFGSTERGSRFIFNDMQLSNFAELNNIGIEETTEIKFENTINRFTGVANPRQIERVIRGCRFGMNIIYNISEEKDVINDVKLLAEAMRLLQLDYLGGHGSRGYGRITYRDLSAKELTGELNADLVNEINSILEDVKPYELWNLQA